MKITRRAGASRHVRRPVSASPAGHATSRSRATCTAFLDECTDEVSLKVNGEPVPLEIDKGYARIERSWKQGDTIELDLPMPVRRVVSHDQRHVQPGQGRPAARAARLLPGRARQRRQGARPGDPRRRRLNTAVPARSAGRRGHDQRPGAKRPSGPWTAGSCRTRSGRSRRSPTTPGPIAAGPR